jgi:hypothetical protein
MHATVRAGRRRHKPGADRRPKAGETRVLRVEHGKLAGAPDLERWKAFWRAYLGDLRGAL